MRRVVTAYGRERVRMQRTAKAAYKKARHPLDHVHFYFHFVMAIWLAWLGYQLSQAVQRGVPADCGIAGKYLPDWTVVWIGIAALLVGRCFGLIRARKDFSNEEDPKASRISGQLAMAGLFLVLAAVWFFEAMGTARVAVNEASAVHWEPITYYVRCAVLQDLASHDNGLLVGGLVATVCFLAGHWLWAWHPKLRDTHPVEEEDAMFT